MFFGVCVCLLLSWGGGGGGGGRGGRWARLVEGEGGGG